MQNLLPVMTNRLSAIDKPREIQWRSIIQGNWLLTASSQPRAGGRNSTKPKVSRFQARETITIIIISCTAKLWILAAGCVGSEGNYAVLLARRTLPTHWASVTLSIGLLSSLLSYFYPLGFREQQLGVSTLRDFSLLYRAGSALEPGRASVNLHKGEIGHGATVLSLRGKKQEAGALPTGKPKACFPLLRCKPSGTNQDI